MSDPAKKPSKSLYWHIVKWCRRISAFAFNFLLIHSLAAGESPLSTIREVLLPVTSSSHLSFDGALAVILITWYAFLSQLRISWCLWLPFYLLLFPGAWILWILVKITFVSLWKRLKAFEEGQHALADSKKKPKHRLSPKRIWVLFFFLWLVFLSGPKVAWALWVPPILAAPIWFLCLKYAYRLAISQESLTAFLAGLAESLLDSRIKILSESPPGGKRKAGGGLIYGVASAILRRYHEDKIQSVLQRESLGLFSAFLGLALIASAWFWGLVGKVLLSTNTSFEKAYDFFSSGSLVETMLWAWGCMTTTVDFPGANAPIWLKLIHAAILGTGLFQLTFLLACFSIMASTEASRTMDGARRVLQVAQEKLDKSRALEVVVVEAVDVAAAASPSGSANSALATSEEEQGAG